MKVIPKKNFIKEVECLPKSYREKVRLIVEKIIEANSLSEIVSIKKMVGYDNYYRIRIGYFRLGIELLNDNEVSLITIKKREDIYKFFP